MKRIINSELAAQVFICLFLLGVFAVTFLPFWNILVLSLNDARDSLKGGVMLWPRVFTLDSYKAIFTDHSIFAAAKTTVARTVLGVLLTISVTSLLAYGLSKRTLPGRRWITLFFVLTMYFQGGLIPEYLVIKSLGLLDSFAVYLVPKLINVFWLILLRTYMEGIPLELTEAAELDGANDLVIFARVVMPLCVPIISTIVLFSAIWHWNAWYDSYIYTSKPALTTLSAELVRVLNQFQTGGMMTAAQQMAQDSKKIPVSSESIRMAVTMVTVLPIILFYPFLQKYLIKGMVVGAIKS